MKKLIVILIFVVAVLGCQRDEFEKVAEKSGFSVNEAKEMFGQNWTGEFLLKSAEGNTSKLGIKPDWERGTTSQNDEVEAVEVGLLVQGRFDITDETSYKEYEKTKNEEFVRSLSRLVLLKFKNEGRTERFLMTISGDLNYHKNKIGCLDDNSYLLRDKHFSGRIYYHDLNGNFVNGWVYEKGEIVSRIKSNSGDGLAVQLKMATTCITTYALTSYVQCTDWYRDWNNNGEIDTGDEKTSTACGDPYIVEVPFTECPVYFTGLNGIAVNYITDVGGTNGGYEPPNSQTPKKYQAILRTNYLDVSQTNLLELALNELINEGCLTSTLYNTLVGQGVKLDFKMGSSYPALYSAYSKTISFNNNSTITSGNLKEELFHALQDAYYSGGIGQYVNSGKVNVEFETKLYKDIMLTACCCAFNIGNAPENVRTAYNIWVLDIQGDPSNISNSDYQYWLGLFNQYTPEYSSPLSPNLSTPNLLKSLMLNCLN
jgi:hypothetical protein